jgi:GNAT superfamily N-acetyltransferase
MEYVKIEKGYTPGLVGRVAELHGIYYHKHWGFGLFFEAKVAAELIEFLKRYDERRDGFWAAAVEGRVEGCITVDGLQAGGEGAHLRWFIVSESFQGRGIGGKLMDVAIDYCRKNGYKRVSLWTFEGLKAARHLYEKTGFRLIEERRGTQWGREVNEQQFLLQIK